MENKIGMAKQNGSYVEVYDESGSYLFSRTGELVGFTLNTVAIKEGNSVCVYGSDASYKYSR